MPEDFEIIKTKRSTPSELRRVVESLRRVPRELELDPARGTMMELGKRQWAFVMTKQAVENWDQLGKKPIPLAVLAHQFETAEDAEVQRVLVALPGTRGKIKLEMRDNMGQVLWTGTAEVKQGELEFSMPITRPRVSAKGLMAGRINSRGELTLSDARLPKPTRKKEPQFVSED